MLARQLSRIGSHGSPLVKRRGAHGGGLRAFGSLQFQTHSMKPAPAGAESTNRPQSWLDPQPVRLNTHDAPVLKLDQPLFCHNQFGATSSAASWLEKLPAAESEQRSPPRHYRRDLRSNVDDPIRDASQRPGLHKFAGGPGCRLTPSAVLMDLVNNGDEVLPDEQFNKIANFILDYPVKRQPVLLAALLLSRDERFGKTRKGILDMADAYGLSRSALEQHERIVLAPTSDAMVERFVSSDSLQPVYLLSFVLRPNAVFTDRQPLESLLRYMARWYAEPGPASNILRPSELRIPIHRLVAHCCRTWPDLLPAVARMVASHIEQMGVEPKHNPHKPRPAAAQDRYAAQVRAYNMYLGIFAAAPDRQGRQYMDSVWEAQKILLAMSSGLPKPLPLEKKSFEAIRLVLLGLEKTGPERDAADRLGRMWPPYKVVRDGLDQQKEPEDDYTRPIRAGMAMQETGYVRTAVDDVIDTLAGMAPDGSPAIQTRANLPGLVTRGHKVGPEEAWATRIRATRNAHEAWLVFQQPPDEPCRRNHKVYGEMFQKLTASPSHGEHYQAGDGRHVVEVQIPNLSDFEKARLQPPTVAQLYTQMLREGIKPQGHCLTVLLLSAPHITHFHKYVMESTLDEDVIGWFTGISDKHVGHIYSRLPYGAFQAYIGLLCRLHPPSYGNNPPSAAHDRIPEAIRLVTEYAAAARTQSRQPVSVRPLWTKILDRLSRPGGVSFAGRGLDESNFSTLLLYIEVLGRARKSCTLNRKMFFYTSRAVRNAMTAQYGECLRPGPAGPSKGEGGGGGGGGACAKGGRSSEARIREMLKKLGSLSRRERKMDISTLEAQYRSGKMDQLCVIAGMANFLAATFSRLSTPVAPLVARDGTEYPMPPIYHHLAGMDAHIYMQTLAHLADYEGMLRLLEWIAGEWRRETSEKSKYHLKRAVACFRALGELDTLRVLGRSGTAEGEARAAEAEGEAAEAEAEALEAGAGDVEGAEGGAVRGELGDAELDEARVVRAREELREMGAWPEDVEVEAYLGATHAASELARVLGRVRDDINVV